MGVTFFDLNKPKKASKSDKQKEMLVELEEITIDGKKPYFTYVDIDGVEKQINGGFTKTFDGSYAISKTEIGKYSIYEAIAYTYKNIDSHLSYADNSGIQRTFNRPETLQYDEETMSYIGEVGNIEYVDIEVELIEQN